MGPDSGEGLTLECFSLIGLASGQRSTDTICACYARVAKRDFGGVTRHGRSDFLAGRHFVWGPGRSPKAIAVAGGDLQGCRRAGLCATPGTSHRRRLSTTVDGLAGRGANTATMTSTERERGRRRPRLARRLTTPFTSPSYM